MLALHTPLTLLPRPHGLEAALVSTQIGPRDTEVLLSAYRTGAVVRAESDRGLVDVMVIEVMSRTGPGGETVHGFTLNALSETSETDFGGAEI